MLRIFGALVAALSVALSVLVLGALTLHLGARLSGAVALSLAVTSALLFTIVLPALLDRWVTSAYRKLDRGATATLLQTLTLWNVALIAFALFAAPKTTRSALVTRGAWMAGSSPAREPVQRSLRFLAEHIPRSEATATARPEPLPMLAPSAAPPSSASAVGAGPAPSAAPPVAAPPPVVPDTPQTPGRVFELRADAVVVIRARSEISEDAPGQAIFEALGIRTMPSFGSGFLVSDDGLIVTNQHVVDGASALEVRLKDGRRFSEVTIEAVNEKRDLALLRVEGQGLARAPLAPDEAVAPGARAIAIGSPLGLEFSVTDGIVSNTRTIGGTRFLQMQTTVAPGSSGGPLFDDRARVIGVNTATKSAGINLAVSVAHVHELIALPRTPRRLSRYPAEAKVSSVTVNGGAPSAVDAMQLEDALTSLVLPFEGCVKSVPDGARLSLTYVVRGRTGLPHGAPTVDSNLEASALSCLERSLQLFGVLLATKLVHAHAAAITQGQAVSLEFVLEGLPVGAEPPSHPLAVTLSVRR